MGSIVIGAQGMTDAQELLIGRTACEVICRATVPVLLHKFEVIRELGLVKCRQLCKNLFQRMLNLTDFSKCADAAFQVVKRLGAAGAQEVVLLHIQDERVMKHRSQEQLAEFDRLDTERLEDITENSTIIWYSNSDHVAAWHSFPGDIEGGGRGKAVSDCARIPWSQCGTGDVDRQHVGKCGAS